MFNHEPTNSDRADWAENAVNVFGIETYSDRTFTDTVKEQPGNNGDAYTMIADLICDLLHLADRHGWDAKEILASATGNYDFEVAEALECQTCNDAVEARLLPCAECGKVD